MLEKKSSERQGNERLAERRRRRRRRGVAFFVILLLLLLAASIYGLQQSAVRISVVRVIGGDESLSDYAKNSMTGNYLGIIPRDSIFFFPEDQIRAGILSEHPNIAAVSITRDDFSSVSIKINERAPVARWCGLAPTPNVEEYCYVFDAHGLIFAAAATSTQTINGFILYAPLHGNGLEPLRSAISSTEKLPAVFDFARKLSTFGSPVSKIIIRNDEVDDYVESGTRITYLLGDEEGAFTALMSSKENLNLADGSVEYVDLRFNGKVYLKKAASGEQ